jgi:EAL domain-containing protein (putative c-di-GMP-specific phosphodiesterase class I)/GGDEF domain-containing protein
MDRVKPEGEDFLLESWLELRNTVEANPAMKRLLFDPVTGLPTTPLLFPRIESLLRDRGEVSILCLNVVRYSKIEEIYGWMVFDTVMRDTANALVGVTGVYLRDSDIVAEVMISGNSFVVVLSPPRNTPHIEANALQDLADRVEARVREALAETMDPAIYRKFGCYTGSATVKANADVRVERLVYDGLEKALADSHVREEVDIAERRSGLRAIIEKEQVHTLVQPILDLTDFSVVGYEALSRGPEGGEFERPDKLFAVAYDSDLVMQLERLCRRRAIDAAKDLPEGRLLFLNIEPESIADPELREAMFSELLAGVGLHPERVILELTERAAIIDFAGFRSTLEYLRALGFSVAVDDAGAGYGSLQCLAEVRPQWLKVDMSLIHGIDKDIVRRQLVMSLVTFATEMGVKLIAEGIETREELDVVLELKVPYGQGFLFSEPVAPFPDDIVFKR